MIRATILACLLITLAARAADEWPQFRGPTGQGIADVKTAPLKWSQTENVAWKVPVAGGGWSSPVVSGGKVYLTTAVKNAGGASLRAVCLNLADGKSLWDSEVLTADSTAVAQIHKKNSLASPTPIVTKDRLYVHFAHMGTAALDLSGKVVWRQTELKFRPVHGTGGSPALVGDQLVFSCDGAKEPFIVALDAGTGAVKWKIDRKQTTARNNFSFSTPLEISVAGQKQIVLPGSGHVAAYEPGSGREIWRVGYGMGYSVVPRPVFAHELLFIGTGFDRPNLLAIRPAGANGDVTKSHVAWKSDKNAPLTPSALVVGDEVYFVSDSGFATCADAKTGKVHWTERLGGGFSSSPVFAAGHIYCQNEAGSTYLLKAGKEFKQVANNELDERTLASQAVVEGAILIRTETNLYRIGGQP